MDKTSNIKPYVKQLGVATGTVVKEQSDGKRKGMNRFLKLPETKKGGAGAETVHRIFAIVVKVVP